MADFGSAAAELKGASGAKQEEARLRGAPGWTAPASYAPSSHSYPHYHHILLN